MTNLIQLTDSIIISDFNYVANQALLSLIIWGISCVVLLVFYDCLYYSINHREAPPLYGFVF